MKIIDNDYNMERDQSGVATITSIYPKGEKLSDALRAVAKYCKKTGLNSDDMRAIEIIRSTIDIDHDSLKLWEVRYLT